MIMDNKIPGKIKKIYYRNIRLSQIYGALSRKTKDSDTSLLFHRFSSDAYNHARGIKFFIESNGGNVSIIRRLLHELDSFWIGRSLYYLGLGFVKKYTIRKELQLRKMAFSLLHSVNEATPFNEIIKCTDEHIEKIQSL